MLVEGAGSAVGGQPAPLTTSPTWASRAPPTCRWCIIGDIDRGGVIASLVGTKAVLDPDDAALVAGFIVNKFRGDPSLFIAGKEAIAQATGWPALGSRAVFSRCAASAGRGCAGARSSRRQPARRREAQDRRADPAADRQFRRSRSARGGDQWSIWCACIPARRCPAMPISSSCRARRRRSPVSQRCATAGFDIDIAAHVRRGGTVLGLCGGYQMLGRTVADPDGIEGPAGTVAGLGLLDVETVLSAEKRLTRCTGTTSRRHLVLRLRDAYGRDDGRRLRAAVRASRRRHAGGRGVRRTAA